MNKCDYITLSREELHKNYKIKKYKKYSWLWSLPINAAAKGLYEHLRMYSRNGWCAWPRQETLAMEFGCHIKTIQRRLKELSSANLIITTRVRLSGVWRQIYLFVAHPDMPSTEQVVLREAHDCLTRMKETTGMRKKNEQQSDADAVLDETVEALLDMFDRARQGDTEAIKQIVGIHAGLTKKRRENSKDEGGDKDAELSGSMDEARGEGDSVGDNLSPPPIYKETLTEEKITPLDRSPEDPSQSAARNVDANWSPSSFSDQEWIDIRYDLSRDDRLPVPVRGTIPDLIGKVVVTNKEKRLILYFSNNILLNMAEKSLNKVVFQRYGFSCYDLKLQSIEQREGIQQHYFQQEEQKRKQRERAIRQRIREQDNLPAEQQYQIFLGQYPRKTKQDTEAKHIYVQALSQKVLPPLSHMIKILQAWRDDATWKDNEGKYIPGLKRYLDDQIWRKKMYLVC